MAASDQLRCIIFVLLLLPSIGQRCSMQSPESQSVAINSVVNFICIQSQCLTSILLNGMPTVGPGGICIMDPKLCNCNVHSNSGSHILTLDALDDCNGSHIECYRNGTTSEPALLWIQGEGNQSQTMTVQVMVPTMMTTTRPPMASSQTPAPPTEAISTQLAPTPTGMTTTLTSTTGYTPSPSPPTESSNPSSPDDPSSPGIVAGVVVGTVVALIIIMIIIVTGVLKCRNVVTRTLSSSPPITPLPPHDSNASSNTYGELNFQTWKDSPVFGPSQSDRRDAANNIPLYKILQSKSKAKSSETAIRPERNGTGAPKPKEKVQPAEPEVEYSQLAHPGPAVSPGTTPQTPQSIQESEEEADRINLVQELQHQGPQADPSPEDPDF